MNNIYDLTGKIAIVTGGAGHLGRSISQALVEYGAKVIVVGRIKDIELKGCEYYSVNLNLFSIDGVVDKIIRDYKGVDILINAAYSGNREEFFDLELDDLYEGLMKTVSPYFKAIKEVAPIMLSQGEGSIINIASLFSYLAPDQRMYLDTGNAPSIHYAVGKHGVLGMTRYLATLWADKGIRVNAISPGWFPKNRGEDRPDYMAEITRRIPMGRIGQPSDLAGVAIYLASDASSYVTGQNIVVDGGYSVW